MSGGSDDVHAAGRIVGQAEETLVNVWQRAEEWAVEGDDPQVGAVDHGEDGDRVGQAGMVGQDERRPLAWNAVRARNLEGPRIAFEQPPAARPKPFPAHAVVEVNQRLHERYRRQAHEIVDQPRPPPKVFQAPRD